MSELSTCPFCSGACAVTKGYCTNELPWSNDGGDFFRVFCSRCQSRQLFHRTEAEAIEAWNLRAASPSVPSAQGEASARAAELKKLADDALSAFMRNGPSQVFDDAIHARDAAIDRHCAGSGAEPVKGELK
jgi:hypothetical protein